MSNSEGEVSGSEGSTSHSKLGGSTFKAVEVAHHELGVEVHVGSPSINQSFDGLLIESKNLTDTWVGVKEALEISNVVSLFTSLGSALNHGTVEAGSS